MMFRVHDWLDGIEAEVLANFLVEVLGLEEAISEALIRFYAHPDHADEFARQFVNRLTLGVAEERLRPVLDHFNFDRERRKQLRVVIDIRNEVAHGRPRKVPGEGYHAYYTKQHGVVRVDDLNTYTVMAMKVRALIDEFPWPT